LSEPDDVSSDVVDDGNSGGAILTPAAAEAAAAAPTPALLALSNHDDVGRSAAVEIDGGVTPSNDETVAGTTGVCDESDAAADADDNDDDDDDESDGIMGANDAVDGGRKKGDGTALAVAKLAKCSGAPVADIDDSECDSGVGDGARVDCSSGVGAPDQTRFALLGNAVASMARRLASLITEARVCERER
jgi:hypothetical protein